MLRKHRTLMERAFEKGHIKVCRQEGLAPPPLKPMTPLQSSVSRTLMRDSLYCITHAYCNVTGSNKHYSVCTGSTSSVTAS